MKLLFTGASGFLGGNILPILRQTYRIQTVGLSNLDDYQVNIAQDIPVLSENYDIVLHAAGKAHVIPKTEVEKQLFFDINYQGTKNLCAALEKAGLPTAFIFISTVAVYGCDYGVNITEEFPLKGDTPYALSKRMAEDYLIKWCEKHEVKLSILRPSLLAGPTPPGNLGKMIDGIRTGHYFSIGGGKALKSVLMVQDIALLVPLLIEKGGVYNVCSDNICSFGDLEKLIAYQLGKSNPFSLPLWVAKFVAIIGDCIGKRAPINSLHLGKITKTLTFSNEKAKQELGWQPLSILANFKIE